MAETKCQDYDIVLLIEHACDSFDNDYDWGKDGDNYDKDDIVHEVADNTVPFYYWDIAQYAAWNSELMQEIPDTGRKCEPYKMIQMNIYEAICEGLYKHIAKKEEEDE